MSAKTPDVVRDIIPYTALVSGSDPVRLLARLDGCRGQVLYVEEPNRNWLASFLEEGRDLGVLLRFRGQ